MLKRSWLVLLLWAVLALPMPAFAGGGGIGGGTAAGQAQQSRLDNARATMEATDDQWKKIEPLLTKVLDLSRQVTSPGGGQPGYGAVPPQSVNQGPAHIAQRALDTAVRNNASDDDLAKALKTFREAREKAQADLAAAKKELKDAVNARQHAVLVSLGYM
jgi:hypothetical protein